MSRSREGSIAAADGAEVARRPPNDWGGLRSALTWAHVVAFGIVAIVLALGAILAGGLWWDRDRRLFHRIAAWWGGSLARTLPFSVELRGREHASGGPYVIVANHQSVVDLLVLYLLPLPYRTLARRALFFTPMGLNMWAAGYLPTPRRRPDSLAQLMCACRRWLSARIAVLVFPEGARSDGVELGRFHRFAFDLASQAGVPVLPVALAGTNDVAPRGTWRFGYGCHIVVDVLPPMPSGARDPPDLLEACRSTLSVRVAALREELRTRHGQGVRTSRSAISTR